MTTYNSLFAIILVAVPVYKNWRILRIVPQNISFISTIFLLFSFEKILALNSYYKHGEKVLEINTGEPTASTTL